MTNKWLVSLLSVACIFSMDAYAGSHESVYKSKGTCSGRHSSITMMGQLPLQMAGEGRCVEEAQVMGNKEVRSGTCTYSIIIDPSQQPPMLKYTASCRNYGADGNTLLLRFEDNVAITQLGGVAKGTVMGGTGKFKGASGAGTIKWGTGPMDPNDPMRNDNTYEVSVKLRIP